MIHIHYLNLLDKVSATGAMLRLSRMGAVLEVGFNVTASHQRRVSCLPRAL